MKEKFFLTIPQIAEETQTRASFWYERSRFGNIPGQLKIGKYVRIDRERFYAALRSEGGIVS